MRNLEIGSEFHLDCELQTECFESCQNVFGYLEKYHTQYFDSGRSALFALLTNLKYKKVLLPDYICESVRICFRECEVAYYHIKEDFTIDWDDLLAKCTENMDIVYLHYFNGYIGEDYAFPELNTLRMQNHFVIIEDTTHSLFTASRTIGDYCICSLRKWFPIPDGGVLYSVNELCPKKYSGNHWVEKKTKAMIEKGSYLGGNDVRKEDFLNVFSETELLLDAQTKPYGISDTAVYILQHIDVNNVIAARCRNSDILNKRLPYKNVALNGAGQVPLFFTISVDNRDDLRKYLIDKKIYCPVHWPLYKEIEQIQGTVLKHNCELSIPIDQRYSAEDMEYISDVIADFSIIMR